MQCDKCGHEAPPDAIYCPHCTRNEPTTEKRLLRGGMYGALFGALIGLPPSAWLLAEYGLQRGYSAIAFMWPVATITTGLIIGLVRARGD